MRLAALALAAPFVLAPFPAPALAQNLVANPALVRDLPPPGWLADRHADWVAQHPVYQTACQTPDVSREIAFLNRIVGRDEDLLVLAGNPPEGNSSLAREAKLASQEMDMLRNDIAAVDGLVAQLQALPACAPAAEPTQAAAAPTAAAATSIATPPSAAPAPQPPAASPPVAPVPPTPPVPAAAAAPAPDAAVAPPPVPPATPPIPAATAAAPPSPSPDAAQAVTLRFDDKIVALTPRSIRAFDKAVETIRAGKPVRLAIEGCDTGADFSKGAVCGERLRSLEALLKDNGVRDPKRLLSDAP